MSSHNAPDFTLFPRTGWLGSSTGASISAKHAFTRPSTWSAFS